MYSTGRSAYKQILPGILLGALVILGMTFLSGVTRVMDELARYRWIFFGWALLLSLANSFLRFLKRQYYLNLSGIRPLSWSKSLQLFLASFPLAATPIRIGECYKGLWLNRIAGVPLNRSIPIYTVDHLSDGLSVLVLSLFGALAYPLLWPLFAVIFLLFILAILSLKAGSDTKSPLGLRQNLQFFEVFLPDVQKSVTEYPTLFNTGALVTSFIIGLTSWFADGMALYFILLGFGFTASWNLVGISFLVFSFSLLMGFISNLPGGMGVVELAMAALLTVLLGRNPEQVVVVTVLFRFATFWAGFGIGLLVWVISGKYLGIHGKEGRVIEG
ncbi:MAG TPA: hypothetical protein DDW19_07095 [Anaerolineaceae bacterium]|nr:hypothetical protein [Anaerolineaceae bacterium]